MRREEEKGEKEVGRPRLACSLSKLSCEKPNNVQTQILVLPFCRPLELKERKSSLDHWESSGLNSSTRNSSHRLINSAISGSLESNNQTANIYALLNSLLLVCFWYTNNEIALFWTSLDLFLGKLP